MTYLVQRGRRELNALQATLTCESRVIETTRGPIEYAEYGNPTRPPLLVLHGAFGGFDHGLYLTRQLGPDTARCIAPSRPGYLRTPLHVGRSLEEQAHACAALLDALAIERVGLIGFSAGGPVAVWFAHLYPDRCWGLILASAVAHPWRATWQTRLLELIPENDLLRWAMLTYWPTLVMRSNHISAAQQAQFALNPAALSGLLAMGVMPKAGRWAGSDNDRRQLMNVPPLPFEALRQPALILHCQTDWLVPPSHARYAARALPHAASLLLNSGGHLAWFSNHLVTVPAMQAFVSNHAPGLRFSEP
jgi:pimeloyl-ACP methyl ester carboxylesterase